MRWDHVLSNNTFYFSATLTKLHLRDHLRRNNPTKTHFLSKDLPVYEFVIATLLGTNVMPRARGESEVSMGFSHDHERNWRRKKEDSIDDEEEEEEAIAEGGPTTTW
ncbi:hypothetical protein M9H77_07208 [Catharanthus roseus]|uniref:Uncharacterized protein n=1 Tax=Catharanthus roseus TaxID=4058 RepID=A0ACC0BUN9_CATRO|nr:hypothetical protein M9H77_07208 [Catharanthus roseus]